MLSNPDSLLSLAVTFDLVETIPLQPQDAEPRVGFEVLNLLKSLVVEVELVV